MFSLSSAICGNGRGGDRDRGKERGREGRNVVGRRANASVFPSILPRPSSSPFPSPSCLSRFPSQSLILKNFHQPHHQDDSDNCNDNDHDHGNQNSEDDHDHLFTIRTEPNANNNNNNNNFDDDEDTPTDSFNDNETSTVSFFQYNEDDRQGHFIRRNRSLIENQIDHREIEKNIPIHFQYSDDDYIIQNYDQFDSTLNFFIENKSLASFYKELPIPSLLQLAAMNGGSAMMIKSPSLSLTSAYSSALGISKMSLLWMLANGKNSDSLWFSHWKYLLNASERHQILHLQILPYKEGEMVMENFMRNVRKRERRRKERMEMERKMETETEGREKNEETEKGQGRGIGRRKRGRKNNDEEEGKEGEEKEQQGGKREREEEKIIPIRCKSIRISERKKNKCSNPSSLSPSPSLSSSRTSHSSSASHPLPLHISSLTNSQLREAFCYGVPILRCPLTVPSVNNFHQQFSPLLRSSNPYPPLFSSLNHIKLLLGPESLDLLFLSPSSLISLAEKNGAFTHFQREFIHIAFAYAIALDIHPRVFLYLMGCNGGEMEEKMVKMRILEIEREEREEVRQEKMTLREKRTKRKEKENEEKNTPGVRSLSNNILDIVLLHLHDDQYEEMKREISSTPSNINFQIWSSHLEKEECQWILYAKHCRDQEVQQYYDTVGAMKSEFERTEYANNVILNRNRNESDREWMRESAALAIDSELFGDEQWEGDHEERRIGRYRVRVNWQVEGMIKEIQSNREELSQLVMAEGRQTSGNNNNNNNNNSNDINNNKNDDEEVTPMDGGK